MKYDRRIAIVGAGVSGLAAGVLLARSGPAVQMFEASTTIAERRHPPRSTSTRARYGAGTPEGMIMTRTGSESRNRLGMSALLVAEALAVGIGAMIAACGAPPIPHAIASEEAAYCLSCHKDGTNGAPKTPHPGKHECVTCHHPKS
jgi:pyruvate/2-oxoglutarate dehydrogenase complex dihydrolipoamide dehydrogenase (E3) component